LNKIEHFETASFAYNYEQLRQQREMDFDKIVDINIVKDKFSLILICLNILITIKEQNWRNNGKNR